MTDEIVDLRGARKRLVRLAMAACLGLVATLVGMWLIDLAGVEEGTDPVSAGSRPLLAIFMFIVSTAGLAAALGRSRQA